MKPKFVDPRSFKAQSRPNIPAICFTDGACRHNPGPGGWGAVITQGSVQTEINGFMNNTTNNQMEMTAAIEALSILPKGTQISITTDSQYLKQGIQGWIHKWKRNGWKLSTGAPVKNSNLWVMLDQLTNERKVEWKWVKGHVGNELNERADRLATSAISDHFKQPKGVNNNNNNNSINNNIIIDIDTNINNKNDNKNDNKTPVVGAAQTTRNVPPPLPQTYKYISLHEFLEKHDPRNVCYVYTDGACSGNPGPGGWGAVIQQDGFETEMSGGDRRTTNNRMEMTAMIRSVSALPKNSVIELTTDSQYLKDGVLKWMKKWKQNGWKTSQNTDVKNQDLWIRIDEIKQEYQIRWEWVKGHADHTQNERCDRLAVEAIPK